MAQDVRYAVALTTSQQADLVFIIVNHDEVVRTAEQHGSGDSSLFSNAMGFVSKNQVFISCTLKDPSTNTSFIFSTHTMMPSTMTKYKRLTIGHIAKIKVAI